MKYRAFSLLAASMLIPSVAFAHPDKIDSQDELKPVIMRNASFSEMPTSKTPVPPFYNVLKNLGLNISEADYQMLSKGGSISSDQFADYHNYRMLSGVALGDDVDFAGLIKIYQNSQKKGLLPEDIATVNSAELFKVMQRVGIINKSNADDFGQAIQHPDIHPPLDSHQDDIFAAAKLPTSFGLSAFLMSRLYDYHADQGEFAPPETPDYVVVTSLPSMGIVVPGGYILSTADNIKEEHQVVSVFSTNGKKLGSARVEMCAQAQYVANRRQCLLKTDLTSPAPVQIAQGQTFRFKNDFAAVDDVKPEDRKKAEADIDETIDTVGTPFVNQTGAPFITNNGYLAGVVMSYKLIGAAPDNANYAFVEQIAPEIISRISADYPSPSQPKLPSAAGEPGKVYDMRYYPRINVETKQVIQIK